jgi:hypothetical protein
MMLKRWCLVASVIMVASLVITAPVVSAESYLTFRQKNGLQAYSPPAWFSEGHFLAREKNPNYVFGPVRDFVQALGGKATWLIEDLELNRLEQAVKEGKTPEYSLYLEAVTPDKTQYWVFVVMPHETAQEWFDARRAFHGGKAQAYYGKTREELEYALRQGFKVKAELRFLIEKGETSLEAPADIITRRYKFGPVFDLGAGRRTDPDTQSR